VERIPCIWISTVGFVIGAMSALTYPNHVTEKNMTIKENPTIATFLREIEEERACDLERVLSDLDYLDFSLREAQRDVGKLKNSLRELLK
jgi:hypothetical protein